MALKGERYASRDIPTAAMAAIVGIIALRYGISAFLEGMIIIAVLLIGVTHEEWLLFIVMFSAIFYTPLTGVSTRIGGILIIPMDVLYLLLMCIIMVKPLWGERIFLDVHDPLKYESGFTHVVTGVFLVIFFAATIQGFFQYHYWQTILTEAKVGLYFGAIPLLADLFRKRTIRLETFLIFVVSATSLGCVYDLYARICHVYTVGTFTGGAVGEVSYAYMTAGEIVRDYGWGSTFVYQVFSVLISFTFFLKAKDVLGRFGWICLFVINLLSNLLTVTRGFMVGLFVGLTSIIFLSSLNVPLSEGVFRMKRIGRMMMASLVLLGLVVSVVWIVPQTGAAFDRIYGLYDGHYAGDGDVSNMEFRIQSMQTGLSSAWRNPLGMGFGYMEPSSSLSSGQERIRKLVYHNSLGFMLYKFGFPGTFLILGIFSFLILRLYRLRNENETDERVRICLISSLLSLLSMSFTSTNWLFDHSCVLPFVVVLIAVSVFMIDDSFRIKRAWLCAESADMW
ncbi:MAG: hypothetical protein ACP5SH_04895 [Syntrophobacteraceae bacterium]